MNKEKQIEDMGIITDLLIDFDEMGFAPTTLCYDPEAYAIEWRNKITNALQGYRKASEVAREIFEKLEKTLNRKIARSKPQFDKLHQNEKDLSIWGYKDMGYFQGIIATCEDLQDLIAELKKNTRKTKENKK